jgi:hypothetical protein
MQEPDSEWFLKGWLRSTPLSASKAMKFFRIRIGPGEWLLTIIFLGCFIVTTLAFMRALPAQTQLAPGQIPWRQVNWNCGSAGQGTAVNFEQLARPAGSSADPCWPWTMQAAWLTIIEKCARCHGADIIPGDTHLVGGLDLRTREAALQGGSRGPAIRPGVAASSLIYRFAAKPQWPTATAAETIEATTTNDDALGMPPFFRLQPDQIEMIRAWIEAGAPVRP